MEGILGLIRTAFDLFKHVVDNSPAPLWPLLTAVAFSMAITQRAKRFWPATWTTLQRDIGSQCVAFWTALLPCWQLWDNAYSLYWGAVAGISSPVLWKYVVVPVAGYWSPLRRLKLSGDPTNDTDKAGA